MSEGSPAILTNRRGPRKWVDSSTSSNHGLFEEALVRKIPIPVPSLDEKRLMPRQNPILRTVIQDLSLIIPPRHDQNTRTTGAKSANGQSEKVLGQDCTSTPAGRMEGNPASYLVRGPSIATHTCRDCAWQRSQSSLGGPEASRLGSLLRR